jgi:hypothetical protein
VLKRSRRKTNAELVAMEHWYHEVLRLDHHTCIGAIRLGFEHECSGPLRAHHCIRQQILETHIWTLGLGEAGWIDWLWDPSIGATVCDGLHQRHHDGSSFLIPLEWLPARVPDWARAREVMHLLEREHPRMTGA